MKGAVELGTFMFDRLKNHYLAFEIDFSLFYLKLYQLKGGSAFCAADSVSLTMSSGGGMKRLMETDVVVFNHR